MRLFVIMALIGVTLAGYQNCGSDVRTQGLFAESDFNSSVEEGCSNSYCVSPEELLWIKIREAEPYKVGRGIIENGHFTVGGTCGISTYSKHSVIYKIVEGFGAQEIAGTGYLDDICDLGHFQAAIEPNVKSFQFDQKYILTLELIGLGDGNQPMSNPMPSNVSRIEVIFDSSI